MLGTSSVLLKLFQFLKSVHVKNYNKCCFCSQLEVFIQKKVIIIITKKYIYWKRWFEKVSFVTGEHICTKGESNVSWTIYDHELTMRKVFSGKRIEYTYKKRKHVCLFVNWPERGNGNDENCHVKFIDTFTNWQGVGGLFGVFF